MFISKGYFVSMCRIAAFFSFVLFVVSCSSKDNNWSSYTGPMFSAPSDEVPPGDARSSRTERYPWEVWVPGQTLQGELVANPDLRRADELIEQGERRAAVAEYRKLNPESLTPAEREALALRIASTELALDRASVALKEVSRFYKQGGKNEGAVQPHFALILAYAYGRGGDVEQSLAWFSRVHDDSSTNRRMQGHARSGVELLLKSQSDVQLANLADSWQADRFVTGVIGAERFRRSRGGGVEADGFSSSLAQVEPAAPQRNASGVALARFGVLVPLSGGFAPLGQRTKEGIELAVAGTYEGLHIDVALKDEGQTASDALAGLDGLVQEQGVSVVIGPLLSESAIATSDVTRRSRLPQIALAKTSAFPVGGGVFRIGATVESQIRSLVKACASLQLTRIAVVAPYDRSGEEYLEAFRMAAQASGLAIVHEARYSKDDPNAFTLIAQQLEELRPQGVFVADGVPEAARLFSAIRPEFRKRMRPLGPATWDNVTELTRSRTLLEGAVFVSPFFVKSTRPYVQRFVETYRSKFGRDPDFLAAQGFDAATLALSALRRQVNEGVPFSRALHDVDSYEGLTGRMTVDASGEVERSFAIVELRGGEFKEIASDTPTFVYRGDEAVSRSGSFESSRGAEWQG